MEKDENLKQKKKKKTFFCPLCRTSRKRHEAQDHIHSMKHHRKLEAVLGNDVLHECQACEASLMGLNEYAQHISTASHKANFKSIKSARVCLQKTLSTEAINKILERNRTIKKEEKKAKNKEKKKLKQIAAQKQTETLQGSVRKDSVGLKQSNMRAQWQNAHQSGGNVFYHNKENKDFRRQPLPYQGYVQNQGAGFHCLSGGPSGRTWHQSNAELTTWPGTSQCNYYNMQSASAANKDFTSDQLPQNGAIIFDDSKNGGSISSQPTQKGSHHSANPAPVNGSAAAPTPIRDIDVSVMLRQIRRALGVREPCRADREAKRQNKVAATDEEPCRGASSNQGPVVSSSPPAAAAPTQPEQTRFKMVKGSAHVAADGMKTHGPLKSPVPVTQCAAKTMSSELSVNIGPRVRTAHKPNRAQEAEKTRLNATLNKLSQSEMHDGIKRKMQNSVKCRPRFGINLTKPPTELGDATQPKDNDIILSEGFHWESFPDFPSDPRSTLPSSTAEVTSIVSDTGTQTKPQLLEPLEQSVAAEQHIAAKHAGSRHKEMAVSVKKEPILEPDGEDSEVSSAKKRKHNTSPDEIVADKGPGKKKKSKSNKDQHQMDQLLAVSLREDELSHSLQDLDQSLIQARNTLQAAYTEVQRLLLLRQQFMSEVNSLRAKRIEILQGMQEGYSGASIIAEKATNSAAGARFSPLPSSVANQQLPAPTVAPPHPTPLTLPVKQEIISLPPTPPTSHFARAVSSNLDTPPLPVMQPVAFPSELLAPQVKRPPPAAPAAPAAAPAASAPAAASTSTLISSESDSDKATKGSRGKEPVKRTRTVVKTSLLDSHDASESDDSVEMMESYTPVVIHIDESDHEDPQEVISKAPESPQSSVSVEFSSAGTQTSQQNKEDRKVKVSSSPVKDAAVSPLELECVESEEPSLGSFLSHSGPVHGLQIHNGQLYTCSGDSTARAYSLATRECQAVFEGHTNKINCLLVSSLPNMPSRLYTGSSDQTIRCYSVKSKKCLEQLSLPDRVLCLHIAWSVLYVGLANGSVASYDLKTLKQLDVFECHGPRGVSCLATAQEGARRVLLVGSYDSTISVRDAKSGLLLRSLQGHTKTVLCMKVVNDLVFSGSSDTSVHAHNIHTGELVRIYKGHDHAVTSIVILGKVMVTACVDKLVRVYELQSHDRLQVYGGHSDMVMCMAVHKSVIYTGCYDGSVQAVKLNLMKNYRCWWQNCALIFGIAEHLVQHLVKDHTNPNLQTVKCRWRGCDRFFATQQLVQQELPSHMQSHVESDSKVQT